MLIFFSALFVNDMLYLWFAGSIISPSLHCL